MCLHRPVTHLEAEQLKFLGVVKVKLCLTDVCRIEGRRRICYWRIHDKNKRMEHVCDPVSAVRHRLL
jgi:hypothetical protein